MRMRISLFGWLLKTPGLLVPQEETRSQMFGRVGQPYPHNSSPVGGFGAGIQKAVGRVIGVSWRGSSRGGITHNIGQSGTVAIAT